MNFPDCASYNSYKNVCMLNIKLDLSGLEIVGCQWLKARHVLEMPGESKPRLLYFKKPCLR